MCGARGLCHSTNNCLCTYVYSNDMAVRCTYPLYTSWTCSVVDTTAVPYIAALFLPFAWRCYRTFWVPGLFCLPPSAPLTGRWKQTNARPLCGRSPLGVQVGGHVCAGVIVKHVWTLEEGVCSYRRCVLQMVEHICMYRWKSGNVMREGERRALWCMG